MRSLRFVLPVALFAVMAGFLWLGLKPGRDPKESPSPLIGKSAPAFELPLLSDPARTWMPEAMKGQVWLLNIWASWCVPCLAEHPLLTELARTGKVPLIGMNYKDDPAAASAWLGKHGNPYQAIVADRSGRAGFDWGVYGVPETFLIDRQGVIRFKHVGPLTPEVLTGKLLPRLQELAR
jgi:cytochrome c biogenesis protein CcmG/thiol:disulfide interchange protein DsbE